MCLNGQVSATRGWNISLLHKWERLCFFIRPLRALLEHLAVGDVAQRVADVPEYKASEVKMMSYRCATLCVVQCNCCSVNFTGGGGSLRFSIIIIMDIMDNVRNFLDFSARLAPRPHNTLPYHSLIIDQPHHNMPYPVFTCTWEQGVF